MEKKFSAEKCYILIKRFIIIENVFNLLKGKVVIMKKRIRNEHGAVLVTVVAIMLMASILISSVIFFVGVNSSTTNASYRNEQAYLMASSSLQSYINTIEKETSGAGAAAYITNLKSLANAGAETTIDYGDTDLNNKMGTCKLKLENDPVTANQIKITATAEFAGETEKITAYIATGSGSKPVNFSNAIEVLGNSSNTYNNTQVIGDFASLNNGSGIEYTFQNDPKINGSFLIYGSAKINTKIYLNLGASQSSTTRGSQVTIAENFTMTNETQIFQYFPRPAGVTDFNYVNVGKTLTSTNNTWIGESGKDVDVYCSEAKISGGTFDNYGNFHCYKLGTSNGDATFNVTGGGAYIDGDLYVEGDLKVVGGKLKVKGNLYVGGTVAGTVRNGDDTANKTALSFPANPPTRPAIDLISDEYVYMPEDFMVSDVIEGSNNPIASIYKNMYEADGTTIKSTVKTSQNFAYKPSSFDLVDPYVLTDTTTIPATTKTSTFMFKIDESCSFTRWLDSGGNPNNMNGNPRILVEVPNDKDIVIILSDDIKNFDKQINFIVKNNSDFVKVDGTALAADELVDAMGYVTDLSGNRKTDASGDFIEAGHKYHCYFVSDSGVGTTSAPVAPSIRSSHSGFKTTTYNFAKVNVLEYNTYIRMFTDASRNDGNGQNELKPIDFETSFIFDPTINNVYYKPECSDIVFLMSEGSNLKISQGGFFQGSIYAPQATVELGTQSWEVETYTNLVDASGNFMHQKLKINIMGVVIANDFKHENESWYAYQKPSPTSILKLSKIPKSPVSTAYKLVRYNYN